MSVMIVMQGLMIVMLLAVVYQLNTVRREIKNLTEQAGCDRQTMMEAEKNETEDLEGTQSKKPDELIASVLREIFP